MLKKNKEKRKKKIEAVGGVKYDAADQNNGETTRQCAIRCETLMERKVASTEAEGGAPSLAKDRQGKQT